MSTFTERQKSLFNQLKDAEDQYSFSKSNKASSDTDYGVIDRRTYKKLKYEMKQFRGKESIFKRPEANLRECLRAKTVPDYIKNPKKWVYYSLSDVTPDQMSDATNTATALALIREMEERDVEKQNVDEEMKDDVFKKPVFKISKSLKMKPKQEEEKPVFKGNKIVMPEYVVGVSHKKEKKNTVIRKSKDSLNETKTVLKLNHLFEVEDDCDE
ncbi:uncharacterized protein [Battus philenor]|uniref:uncharacterized protein n=1 Tax=Battus philenor TaxID=42288 RepID=UPI0035CF806F